MSQLQRTRRQSYRQKPLHQIILARGDEVRSFHIHGWMIGVAIVGALGLTFWLFAATAYVVFRDDVLASMIARQTRQQYAYEDRIAALRLQVDRVTSRQLLDQDAFTVRLDELLDKQGILERRSQQVSALVDKAKNLGVKLGDDDLTTGSTGAANKVTRSNNISTTLGSVETELGHIGRYQENTLASLEGQMQVSEKNMRSAVADLGISIDALAGKQKTARPQGMGGPFIPLRMDSIESFTTRASYVIDHMDWLKNLRQSLTALPIRKPLQTNDVNSNFGARVDPFTGRPALHAGIDFGGDTGDLIYATANGVVTKAGRLGGYGNLVEVSHSNGIATRYGHMSAILVTVGQKIKSGDVVGKMGSTGRSTGSHLHYETRIDNNAVNPMRFVRAAKKIGTW
ncbi:MAG: M23 family metallopeptidase [Pseudomonadota bacterium]